MSMERSLKQYETDRKEAARIAARLLLASGTTSPRVGGVGECTIHIVEDECDIEDLCRQLEKMSPENKGWDFFKRDAAILRDADAILLITSLRSLTDPADINCNMCGKLTCEYLKAEEKLPREPGVAFTGPLCIFRANNIAYAVDGVVSQARNLGIDYGVYWSVGAAAMRLELLPQAAGFALGVGISITEKSPFRDIPKKYDEMNQRTMNDRIIQRLWPQFRSIYS
ncbi:MAG: DUF2148 domain-containing protein [Pseudomonadota bacterium]